MEELATGSGLLEGPAWDGGLVFSDVPNGGAYRFGEDGSIAPVFEHRRGIAVVTGPAGTGRDDPGTIFRTRVDVPGLTVAPARVALSPGI
ncbi:MAG: hypothetical protein OXC01_12340 [Immundisolibacterales bacterium]|nr:hypothetical protein [Immundisolibacterales bacterium]